MSPAEGISAAPQLKIAQGKQEAERETAFVALAVCLCTCAHFVCMKKMPKSATAVLLLAPRSALILSVFLLKGLIKEIQPLIWGDALIFRRKLPEVLTLRETEAGITLQIITFSLLFLVNGCF